MLEYFGKLYYTEKRSAGNDPIPILIQGIAGQYENRVKAENG